MFVVTAACATEPASAPEPPLDTELAWDLDQETESNVPVCPPDDPDCDRLDEPDMVDDDGNPITADGLVDELTDGSERGDVTAYSLTDPKTGGKYRVWPNGRIPYRLATDSNGNYALGATTRASLSQAMTNWEVLTEGRIKFRQKAASDTAYVLISVGSPRVSPFIGYRAGQVQRMYLRNPEPITVIKHELGHVIGLHHEQRRTDRLTYIQVRSANIVNTTTCKYQFATCTDCVLVNTYDPVSIMHYRTTDLGNCRTGPVLLKKDGTSISHYWQLSAKDLTGVAKLYAPPPPKPYTPQPHPADPDLVPSGSLMAGSGSCADVEGQRTDDGASVIGEGCHGGLNQDWRTTRDGQLRAGHSLRCAAVAAASTPGAVVEQAACVPGDARQQWSFPASEIVSSTGACLETTATGALRAAACSGRADQRFDYQPARESIAIDGRCVTAGERVALEPCDGRPAQRWFQARGGFVPRANTGTCLGIGADGVTLGTAICADVDDQRWALRGTIRDGQAALCLQGTSGQPLALATCDGSAAQTWTFWSR